jgi:hypothetical protein
MDAAIGFLVLVVVIIVILFVAIAALIVGIYFLNRRVVVPAIGGGKAESIIERWVEEHDAELLEVKRILHRNHPFADRFGFGLGKWPGVVYFVEVRTRKGRERSGWVYMRVGPFAVPLASSLEIRWDE